MRNSMIALLLLSGGLLGASRVYANDDDAGREGVTGPGGGGFSTNGPAGSAGAGVGGKSAAPSDLQGNPPAAPSDPSLSGTDGHGPLGNSPTNNSNCGGVSHC